MTHATYAKAPRERETERRMPTMAAASANYDRANARVIKLRVQLSRALSMRSAAFYTLQSVFEEASQENARDTFNS